MGSLVVVEMRAEYHERLRVPLRWWAQGTMLVASLWLAMIVSTPERVAWAGTAVAMALLALGLRWYGDAKVRVEDGWFRAGRARIEARHLGAIDALDADATDRVAGVDADARAFLLLRPYIKRAVRVEITDPTDPAPYWLVSSRHPDALTAALTTLVKR